jgi:hypothetical protein
MRMIKFWTAAACMALAGAAVAAGDADTIRVIRADSNAGILAHQADKAVGGASDDFVLVGGTSGVAHSGKTVVRDYFAEGFKDPGFVTYVRTPGQIVISDDGVRAVEHGTWQGVWRDTLMGGDYQAHWSKRDGKWLDRAEIYVTLQCQGPVCKP